jgi:hypothetical protein
MLQHTQQETLGALTPFQKRIDDFGTDNLRAYKESQQLASLDCRSLFHKAC